MCDARKCFFRETRTARRSRPRLGECFDTPPYRSGHTPTMPKRLVHKSLSVLSTKMPPGCLWRGRDGFADCQQLLNMAYPSVVWTEVFWHALAIRDLVKRTMAKGGTTGGVLFRKAEAGGAAREARHPWEACHRWGAAGVGAPR